MIGVNSSQLKLALSLAGSELHEGWQRDAYFHEYTK
jgi:hypothetical protein